MQNKYTGVKCPVCDTEFKQGDDIAVCPECGTPHHRECINKTGSCANADKHADGFVFELPQASHESMLVNHPSDFVECPRCGEKNPPESTNCSVCQTPLKRETPRVQVTFMHNGQPLPFGMPFIVNPEEEIDGIKAKEVAEHVGQNQRYYMPRFKFLRERWFSWNWGAFFFRSFYFMYRKMWLVGIVIFLLELILEAGTIFALFLAYQGVLAQTPYTLITDVLSVMALALQFMSAAFANKLYSKHVIRKINKLKEKKLPEEEYKKKLSKTGGVSPLSVLVYIVCLLVIGVLAGIFVSNTQAFAQFFTEITEQMVSSMSQGGLI